MQQEGWVTVEGISYNAGKDFPLGGLRRRGERWKEGFQTIGPINA